MTSTPWNDPSLPLEERTDALLAELSLEERIGQLGSYWPRPAQEEGGDDIAPMQSTFEDVADAFDAIAEHGLGHITRAFGSATMPVADGVALLRRLQDEVVGRSRLGIPAIAHEECLTGFMADGATTYPAALAWGATFSPELVREMGEHIGADMRAVGVHLALAPVLDVVRDYRWGRIEETLGEDPYLTGMLTTSYVQGLQSSGIVATLKHFAGHAASRAGRNHAPVSIGPRELRDIDLVPFEMAVRLGRAGAVMNSYADLDGVPPASDRQLLTDLLRGRWGFEGTVVSDYFAVAFLQTMHGVAGSEREAAAMSLHAGMDVELPQTHCFATLRDAVLAGEVDEDDVTQAARRVLRQKIQLGLLDAEPAIGGEAIDLDTAANRDLARRLAEESIVLLENDGALPLAAGGSPRIALVGPNGDDARSHMGCYSFTNHVRSRGDGALAVPAPSLADALREEWPDARLDVVAGVDVQDPDRSQIPAAIEAIRRADVAVLALGDRAGMFGRGTSGEGCDVADLSLPGAQQELLEAALATDTPVVLVLITGRPYALGSVTGRCAAILQAFMPGEEGASAIAGVLSGRVNPSGHLPVGVPAHGGGQPGTYLAPRLAWESEGISNLDPRPLHPFGHGLSYTRFELSDLELDRTEIPADGRVRISATLANVGERSGREVVQLYLSDPVASVVRPLKRLVGFAKVDLEPGSSARITFDLHADRTSFTGRDLRRIVEAGRFTVRVGTSSEDTPLVGEFTITGPDRDVEDIERVLTTPVEVTPLG